MSRKLLMNLHPTQRDNLAGPMLNILNLRFGKFAMPGALAIVAIVSVGCGSTNKPIAKVSGSVTYDSKAVAGLSVMFSPIGSEENREPGKAAFAETDAKGKFTLSTYGDKDGAVVGKHRVTIGYDNPDVAVKFKGKFVGPMEVVVEAKDNVFDFVLE